MPHQVMYVGIQLYHPDRVDDFKARLERMLPRGVEIAGTQVGNMMLEMLEMLDVYAWVVAMIAALVGGVGMMNTVLMSVFERTREIGVLRAVGWRSRQVLTMIMAESFLLSLAGGALGLAAGRGLTWLAAQTPAMAAWTDGSVPPTLVAQSMITAMILGLVGGIYPAWRASRLPPVEALRYDGGTDRVQTRVPLGGMAIKNLGRQRTRSGLTLLGVGIGIVAMVLIGSVGEGAVRTFNDFLASAEIAAVEKDLPDTSLSVIDERVLKRIESLPEVQYVSGMIISVVSTPDEPFFIITARERTDPELGDYVIREGRLLRGNREVLLGVRAAAEHGRRVGDRLSMLGSTFTVVGIVETDSTFEDNGAIIHLREAQRLLNKPNQVMSMQIKLRDPRQTEEMVERLSAAYPNLLFSTSAEFSESLPDMQSTRQAIGAIYVMTVAVGSVALMNTMIMSVFERTREIGVLRAVGWSASQVLGQVLTESLLLTIISGAVGILVSVVIVVVLRSLPSIGYYRDMLAITPAIVGQVMAACFVLGAAGGVYPAWRATRFSPVEALRYE
jgi:ABC-type antimicrobial peptide transport system permease subunit